MKKIFFLATVSLLVFMSSCQKVIDLPVTDAEPKLVIEAKYDAVKEEVFVKLSKSVNVFSTGVYPTINGATVEITDGNSVVTSLVDQGDGSYLLENYTPVYNSTYKMKVIVEGIAYEATDVLVPVVVLDSITDRKSTRLNSSHVRISYAVFCLKKKILLSHLPLSCSMIPTSLNRAAFTMACFSVCKMSSTLPTRMPLPSRSIITTPCLNYAEST